MKWEGEAGYLSVVPSRQREQRCLRTSEGARQVAAECDGAGEVAGDEVSELDLEQSQSPGEDFAKICAAVLCAGDTLEGSLCRGGQDPVDASQGRPGC